MKYRVVWDRHVYDPILHFPWHVLNEFMVKLRYSGHGMS